MELYIYKRKVLEERKYMKVKTEVTFWEEVVVQGLLHLMQYSPASFKKKNLIWFKFFQNNKHGVCF